MDLHLFPVLCRVINSGFEKPAVQLIFDKNQKNVTTIKNCQRTITYTRNAEGGNFSRRLREIVSEQGAQTCTEDLTLANDIFSVPQFQKTTQYCSLAHVLRTTGILMPPPSKCSVQGSRSSTHPERQALAAALKMKKVNRKSVQTLYAAIWRDRVSRPNINTKSALFFERPGARIGKMPQHEGRALKELRVNVNADVEEIIPRPPR
jgi:hypothetical protein